MSGYNESLVSIALCTYNGGKYLREQLDSLMAQTYRWHELIVVDDGSTDDTMSILHEYVRSDPRISLHQNVTKLGPNDNFFKAMSLCSGEFIAPCDQDDIWLPEKLEALLSTIGSHALAYCDSELISSTGQSLGIKISHLSSMISTTDPSCFVFHNCVSGHALLIRRDVFRIADVVPERFNYDWWLAAIAASIGGVIYTDKPLVKHRQHSANTTNTFSIQHPLHKKRKVKGYKLIAQRNTAQRIETLSKINGNHQPFLTNFLVLWRARESQWFCVKLALTLLLHGARLYGTRRRKSLLFLIAKAQRSLWGIRIKRLIDRHAYCL
jgi:glycosyltransferase involved in cell wall biosynthesis